MSQPPEPHTLENSALELSKSARAGNSDPVILFKNFRKEEEERLRSWHDAGGGGREIARQRSDMVDILFRELFDDVVRRVAKNPSLAAWRWRPSEATAVANSRR